MPNWGQFGGKNQQREAIVEQTIQGEKKGFRNIKKN